ncbi:MAG: hypothetical protein JSS49_22615 [Planctomycetes bacterium]|nr:hypothetical protein [Planctomycetota bacterium]
MDRFWLRGLLFPVLLAAIPVPANAQEMRIYTTVRNIGAVGPNEETPVISRTVTLFHAGKVYDWVESAREVTVFEPARHRFTLLNERRRCVTEVAQDELRQYLGLAEQEAWKRFETATGNNQQIRSLAWLKFQLKPEFNASFDQAKLRITMLEHDCRYEAEGQAPPSKGVVESYLRFADATAELNAVLHPHAPLPKPRLLLNEELRRRDLLPVVVDLKADLERPLHLQAKHEWQWMFLPTDRQLISSWDAQLTDPTRRRLGFRQYQQEALSTEVSRNR